MQTEIRPKFLHSLFLGTYCRKSSPFSRLPATGQPQPLILKFQFDNDKQSNLYCGQFSAETHSGQLQDGLGRIPASSLQKVYSKSRDEYHRVFCYF